MGFKEEQPNSDLDEGQVEEVDNLGLTQGLVVVEAEDMAIYFGGVCFKSVHFVLL